MYRKFIQKTGIKKHKTLLPPTYRQTLPANHYTATEKIKFQISAVIP